MLKFKITNTVENVKAMERQKKKRGGEELNYERGEPVIRIALAGNFDERRCRTVEELWGIRKGGASAVCPLKARAEYCSE